MADKLKVLIADEDPDSRVNTRKAVQRVELDIAGEVGFGTAAVSFALESRPDIVLLAVEEPTVRSLETAEALGNALPDTPIIVYSSLADARAIRRAMVVGVRDYIERPVKAAQLRDSIEAVLSQEELRQMRRAGQVAQGTGRGMVITVTGAKGGIGKTVISVNLALALHQETGKSVAVIDADTQFGDVATMLDVRPDQTLTDARNNGHMLDRESVRGLFTQHASGIGVLSSSGEVDLAGAFSPDELKQVIELVAQTQDFVVVDTAGTFDPIVRACMEVSTLTLVVTSGEVSSVRDTATAVKRLQTWEVEQERVKVVLNSGVRVNGFEPSELGRAIGLGVFWQVPHDRRVPTSVQMGRPILLLNAKSPAARNFVLLARTILGTKKSLAQPKKKATLWRRLRGK